MTIGSRKIILIILPLMLFLSCQMKHNGTIEGSVRPPTPSVQVIAVQNEKSIITVPVNEQNGTFKLSVPAGAYTIKIMDPAASFPLTFPDIIVKPGEMTVLPPITLTPPASGTAVLSGRVKPPRPNTEVRLIYEGKERAAVHTDREGRYEFKELPAGTYSLRANSPGYADDVAQVVVPENRKVEQNAALLPIASIDGVDWAAGRIRATGIGLPPQQAENDAVRREMTKRAALADAERNLLKTIEQIRMDSDHSVKSAMGSQTFASKIRGFVKGYTVVSERELPGNRYEMTLELPLNGPSGLSRLLSD